MNSIRDRAVAALRLAMRDRDRDAMSALRGLIGAWDNAGARPIETLPAAGSASLIGVGAADAPRRELDESELATVARAELAEHQDAADAAAARGDRMTAERLARQVAVIAAVLTRRPS